MNKLYLLLFFISVTFFAQAQEAKPVENNPTEIVQAKVLKFYPNPATSIINFEITQNVQRDLTLQIYNFFGKKVY